MTYAACAIVRDPSGRVLALHRKDGFVLPGGGVDRAETPLRAAVREVWEETGLEVLLHPVPIHTTRSTAFFHAIAHTGQLRDGGEGVPVWATWPHLFAHPRHGETARRVAAKLGVRA